MQAGVFGDEQRHRARCGRTGHAGSVEDHKIVADDIAGVLGIGCALGGENIGTVRREVGVVAVVRVISLVIVPIHGVDRNDAAIGRRIEAGRGIAVARCGHKHHVIGHCVINGGLHRRAPGAAAPAVVEHRRAVIHRVNDGGDGIGGIAAVFPEKFERHDFGVRVGPANAVVVVRFGGNRSGHMRTVCAALILNIHRVAIAVIKIHAVDIVRPAVSVVVDSIAGDLAGVRPHLIGEVEMGVVHTGINDGYDNLVGREIRLLPRFEPVHIGIGERVGSIHRAAVQHIDRLAGVVEREHLFEKRIVGHGAGLHAVVRLGVVHVGRSIEIAEHLHQIGVRSQLRGMQIAQFRREFASAFSLGLRGIEQRLLF